MHWLGEAEYTQKSKSSLNVEHVNAKHNHCSTVMMLYNVPIETVNYNLKEESHHVVKLR